MDNGGEWLNLREVKAFPKIATTTTTTTTTTKAAVPEVVRTTTTATEAGTVTMSPVKMAKMDKILTPEVECPESKEDTPADLPPIDIFLNPDR